MYEITEMEKLLREHPEEFPPSLQKGRMVERLSKKNGNRKGYGTCLLYTSIIIGDRK